METTYPYKALLTASSTRILKLLPGSKQAALSFELLEISLDPKPKCLYEALSYVWGSTDPPYFINCGNARIRITKNCHEALLRLRKRLKPRMLWVDAICIDQRSLQERNHQVRLMGHIYSKATTVIAWLGSFRTGSCLD